MDNLGEVLREAREARGLTLGDVQNTTKINSRFLEALEDGNYAALPTAVHVRGYLRNYARYLGLDAQPLVERYDSQAARHPRAPRPDALSFDKPLPLRDDQPFFDPVNVEMAESGHARRDTSALPRLAIILALLFAIGMVVSRFLPLLRGEAAGGQDFGQTIQDVVGGMVAGAEESPTPDAGLLPGAGTPITSTSRNDSALVLPTLTPTRPELPATLETIRLRLDITERTWMQVTIDGEIVFEGQARSGEGPFEWEAQDEAQLKAGNAIAIFVTINDVQLGKLGGRAEVLDEIWVTTGGGGDE
ncbi:MAG: helix-turn-helix domain-containing protein [Candidatus Promineifilaceae bacterium]